MYTLNFNFEQKGIVPVICKNIEPGQTLLEVALKNNIWLHHNCGGVCSCTTCHLYIPEGMEYIDKPGRREKDFIGRAINPQLNSRLACQSLLMDGRGLIKVILPDQIQYEKCN